MELFLAQHGGECFGVRRAIRMVEKALAEGPQPVMSLGPLIHNPQEVERLEKSGLRVIQGLTTIKAGTIVIRSHGVSSRTRRELDLLKVRVVNATCPFVKKVHTIVRELSRKGYLVVVVGDKDHPEVEGIVSYINGPYFVSRDPADRSDIRPGSKVGVVAQTTQSRELLETIVARLRDLETDLVVHDTLCGATQRRQEEVLRRAPDMDLVVVVGGRESANTCRLTQLATSTGVPTKQVESGLELQLSWFEGKKKVFLTAGASTPRWVIKEVITRIRQLIPGIQIKGGLAFND